jgi:hypothetical protein
VLKLKAMVSLWEEGRVKISCVETGVSCSLGRLERCRVERESSWGIVGRDCKVGCSGMGYKGGCTWYTWDYCYFIM